MVTNKMNSKNQIFIIALITILFLIISDVNPSIIVYRVLAGIAVLYCVKKGLEESVIVNPYYLFAITPLSLLLYNESFAPTYLDELSASTWFLALYNIVGFLIGYSFISLKNRRTVRDISSDDVRTMRMHIIICGVLSITPMVCRLLHIPLPLRSFLGFFSYIGLALAFESKNKVNIIISLIFVLLGYLEDFNKSRFLTLVIVVAIFYEAYYMQTKKDRTKLVSFILLGVIFMLLVAFPLKSFIRDGGSYMEFADNFAEISSNSFEYYDDKFEFDGPDFLKMPYMYFISSWNNVQYVMETQDDRTYGLWTLKPFLTYIGLNKEFESAYMLIPSGTFNTFTYISILFKDFGYWGSIVGSLLLGIYVKYTRMRYSMSRSAFDVATYALTCVATFQMYFSNHFFGLSYPFTILIIGWFYKKMFNLNKY